MKVMQLISPGVSKFWNLLEIRILVLLSLAIKTILTLTGRKRKNSASDMLSILLWVTYMVADWAVTVSLSVLSNHARSSCDHSLDSNIVITLFWAPFLLLHLGGPDTITAYSLEDNELWRRHLHYVDRGYGFCGLQAVRSLESMLSPPDAGPNYARYVEEYSSKKDEGFKVSLEKLIRFTTEVENSYTEPVNNPLDNLEILEYDYGIFETFKLLFADLILSFHDIEKSQSFFMKISSQDAFEVIEVELGFIYDVFYTKAVLVYSFVGGFFRLSSLCCLALRCITFISIISVSIVFFFIIEKHEYSRENVVITYVLVAGAIILELYAAILLLCSEWMMLSLKKHSLLYQAISSLPFTRSKRFLTKVLCIDALLEKHRYKYSKKVTSKLKKVIFDQLSNKSRSVSDIKECKKFCDERGYEVLEVKTPHCKASKCLSNYLLYLLVVCPVMLPNGIGQIRFRDTCAEANEFFKERKSKLGGGNVGKMLHTKKLNACSMLLQVNIEIPPSKVKGDRSKSVLFDACRLAKSLQSLATAKEWDRAKKWELICHVWVEMLSYAASHCQWNHHAQRLTQGGELLTHVWLLMAHLGITEQFQISLGHERAKLNVE
uniref:DUF4220 domain-containing protein n=1 Tax=Quercus lobata TaxID=97700 RepID=A0A7N2LLX4_QUELO